ncbi:SEC-C domain-containing protein [Plantactinospora endophytica]|uniref:Preprotein translocase SecA n=1 Tax=Plantactinospora endophytica TaxID=673535 RepID=A0ABQ4E9R2_9ACTN|nr:SEC-C domain-containing protein [Plantactinospora endophytica]GIG91465.1 preprotein translocase SecA [Plantactinospora endophytica]
MPTKDVLSSADLTELRQSALGAANPLGIAAEVADAAEQGRLADPTDAGKALTLAAEIAETRAKFDAALRYADRAVAAYPDDTDPDAGFARALHARILFRTGRADEALAELTALRPLLDSQPDAAAYLSAALDVGGRTDLAEQWLTEAVETALRNRPTPTEETAEAGTTEPVAGEAVTAGPVTGEAAVQEAGGLLFFLLQQRHRVRRELALPHDQNDNLADRLENELFRSATTAAAEPGPAGRLFLPEAELDALLSRWPDLAEVFGRNWDEHRGRVQRELVRLADSGRIGLGPLRGSTEGLAGFAGRDGADPTDESARAGYATELAERGTQLRWPPERNEACWCGSGLKYKKCCLPRTRG